MRNAVGRPVPGHEREDESDNHTLTFSLPCCVSDWRLRHPYDRRVRRVIESCQHSSPRTRSQLILVVNLPG
jgi:hypothetical protein